MQAMYNNYVIDDYSNLNNFELLVYATESFTQLAYFLQSYRNYKNLNLKIGSFDYDDWSADLFCVLDEKEGVYFKHVRDFDNREWKHSSLTEQLIYAWGFSEINFVINFDIINTFWHILSDSDKDLYDELYDEVHSKFW